MPILNLIPKHITESDKTAIDTAIAALQTVIAQYVINLTGEERQRYGSINEKNKLIVNKVWDYRQMQPELSSPDVDWASFKLDFDERLYAETRINMLLNVLDTLTSLKIMHDYDNYQDSTTDYSYTKYKVETGGGGNFKVKRDELAQFFKKKNGQQEDNETTDPNGSPSGDGTPDGN